MINGYFEFLEGYLAQIQKDFENYQNNETKM
mgnify:CR=1 FL=1